MARSEHGPLGKAWTDIGSDYDWKGYGGRWARHIDGTRYHVIRFDNMIEACGRDADPSQPYACDLHEVDIASENLQSALDYCGLDADEMAERQEPGKQWALVEALSSSGAYAPLWQDGGRNAHAMLRVAKRESRQLSADSEAYEARMNRPVNRIGSTAREYQAGDTQSAILRGLADGNPAADIMARMGMLAR
jgi:hypothetical protein